MIDLEMIGITRKIDDLGRVVIPSHIRKEMDLRPGEQVEFFHHSDGVFMRRKSEKDNK